MANKLHYTSRRHRGTIICSISYKISSSSSFGFTLFDVGDEVTLPTSSIITTDSPSGLH
ncbi:unnamed protein product, partial [Rotaria magnacalcarata]